MATPEEVDRENEQHDERTQSRIPGRSQENAGEPADLESNEVEEVRDGHDVGSDGTN